MATALYFIDKLALRAGHEKDEDEADTVGCCTLKVGGRATGRVCAWDAATLEAGAGPAAAAVCPLMLMMHAPPRTASSPCTTPPRAGGERGVHRAQPHQV